MPSGTSSGGKPIGATMTCSASEIVPATEYSLCVPGASAGFWGKESSAHSAIVVQKMIVPARLRKISARIHSPIAMSRSAGS